ncbi:hypothetical protein [Halobaculum litoreum]|uniref:Uncharacterized protein n=1 Tax=Halobaculum litoreum TaxID=3031998 RepID=A0ABD5XVB3_9EURY|nr:hypothetical protein [Halobaculum sp. DT92]
MRRLLALCCLLALAGCTYGAAPQPTPTAVEYNVTNLDAAPVAVEIATADTPVDSLVFTAPNGTERTVPAPYDGDTTAPRTAILRPSNVSAVAAPGASVRATITVDGDASRTGALDANGTETFVVVARSQGRVVAVGLAACTLDTRAYYLDFTNGGYGPGVGIACRGGS